MKELIMYSLSKDLSITNDVDYAEMLECKANEDFCKLQNAILKFAEKGRTDLARRLINHREQLYNKSSVGLTALIYAVTNGYDISIIKALVEAGEEIVKWVDEEHGSNALCYAMFRYRQKMSDVNRKAVYEYLLTTELSHLQHIKTNF